MKKNKEIKDKRIAKAKSKEKMRKILTGIIAGTMALLMLLAASISLIYNIVN